MPNRKMVSIRITDSGEFLDTAGVRIAYSLQSFDLRELAARKGEFSIDFTIPDTPSNVKKLGYATEDFLNSNTTYKRIDVELLQNGEFTKAGYLRVAGRTEGINVVFLSGATDWISLLEGSIRDVDLSDFDHTFDNVDIEAGLIKTDEYVYPLIDYGTWSAKSGLTGDRVDLVDLKPSVYVRDLLIVMFREIGWKIEGELIDDIWFKRLVLPFSSSEFNHAGSWGIDRTLDTLKNSSQSRVGALDNIIFDDEIRNPSLWNGTDTFIPDTNMSIEINVTCTFSAATTSPELEIVDGIAGVIGTTTITGAGVFTVSASVETLGTIIIKMNAPAGTWTITDGSLTIDVNPDILKGAPFEFRSMLPDIDKRDMMRFIFVHRGILPTSNNFSKTLTLSFFNSVSSNTQDNWTAKIDGPKEVDYQKLFEKYGQRTWFRYKDADNDGKLKNYKISNEKNYGDGKFDIDNDFLEKDVDIYETPFAGTISYQSLKGRAYLPFIPFSSNGTDFTEVQDPVFRVLYVLPNIDIDYFINNGSIFFDAAGEITIATFAFFVKKRLVLTLPRATDIDEGLAFDQPNDSDIYSIGMIDRYMDKLERILNNGKIESFKVRLTEVDVREYDITKPVYISQVGGGKLYYKNKLRNFEDSKVAQDVELIPFE